MYVAPFVLSQGKYAGQAVEDLRRWMDIAALLQVGVPGRAQPGQDGDFLAAQAGGTPPVARRKPYIGRLDTFPPAPQEPAKLTPAAAVRYAHLSAGASSAG